MKRSRRKAVKPSRLLAAVEHLESRCLLSGSIQGVIWTDVNANGVWDGPDGRAAGWTVYLDQNQDGHLDAGDPTATTTSLGYYTFTNLLPGTYTIRYVPPDATWHAAPSQPDHLTLTLAGQALTGQNLGVTAADGQISGTVTAAGSPVQSWGVYLDTNGNGRVDPGERWTSTDANGGFSFTSLPAGTYIVRVDPLHPEWSPAPSTTGSRTITSDGLHASAPITFAYQQNPPPARYSTNQLVDYLLIGGGSADAATREVNESVLGNGWRSFISQFVQPDLDWGMKRIELHNPFGVLPSDGAFRTDQFLQAQAAGLSWLTDGFAQAWGPITQSGVEVIGYIGNPEFDPSFQALAAAGDTAGWMARFNASVAPLVQAGMSIGFDLGQRMQQGDLFSQALDGLRASGVKVYLENRPPEAAPYNLTFPVIATDPGWDGSNPYVTPSQYWAAKNSQLTPGSVLQLIQSPPAGVNWTDRQWLLGELQRVMRDGDSVGIAGWAVRGSSLSLNQVLTPANVPTPPAPGTPAPVATPASTPVTPSLAAGYSVPKPVVVHPPKAKQHQQRPHVPKPPRPPRPHHPKPPKPATPQPPTLADLMLITEFHL